MGGANALGGQKSGENVSACALAYARQKRDRVSGIPCRQATIPATVFKPANTAATCDSVAVLPRSNTTSGTSVAEETSTRGEGARFSGHAAKVLAVLAVDESLTPAPHAGPTMTATWKQAGDNWRGKKSRTPVSESGEGHRQVARARQRGVGLHAWRSERDLAWSQLWYDILRPKGRAVANAHRTSLSNCVVCRL